jgi:phage recombination protein Bet
MEQEILDTEIKEIIDTPDKAAVDVQHFGDHKSVLMWTTEQIELIKRTVAKEATDDEFEMYLHFCRTSGLDPLKKQAHFQVRIARNGDRNVIMMAGIDGMRARAERMPDFLGINSGAVYDADEFVVDLGAGEINHIVSFPRNGTLIGAWARVCRQNRTPYVHWLNNAEYRGSLLAKEMPSLMLEKTAEAQALRHEYPEPFSGGYAYEEFGTTEAQILAQDSVVVHDDPKDQTGVVKDPPTDKQRERLIELLEIFGSADLLNDADYEQGIMIAEGKNSTKGQLGIRIDYWKKRLVIIEAINKTIHIINDMVDKGYLTKEDVDERLQAYKEAKFTTNLKKIPFDAEQSLTKWQKYAGEQQWQKYPGEQLEFEPSVKDLSDKEVVSDDDNGLEQKEEKLLPGTGLTDDDLAEIDKYGSEGDDNTFSQDDWAQAIRDKLDPSLPDGAYIGQDIYNMLAKRAKGIKMPIIMMRSIMIELWRTSNGIDQDVSNCDLFPVACLENLFLKLDTLKKIYEK